MKRILLIASIVFSSFISGFAQPSISDDSTAIIKNSPFGELVFDITASYSLNNNDLVFSFLKGDTAGFGLLDTAVNPAWPNGDAFIYVDSTANFTYTPPNNKFEFYILVEDPLSNVDSARFVVTIEPPEPPVISGKNVEINENSASGTYTQENNFNQVFSATDPDGDNSLITFSKKSGSTKFAVEDQGDGTFKIKSTVSNLNYESQAAYSIRVLATDQDGDTGSAVFDIAVKDVNEAPTITVVQSNSSWDEDENTGTVYEFGVTDPDAGVSGHTHSFTITNQTGGAGTTPFQIDGSTGEVTVANIAHIDYETMPSGKQITFTVKVTDGGTLTNGGANSLSDSKTVTISINDVTETINPIGKSSYPSTVVISNLCSKLNVGLGDDAIANPPASGNSSGPYGFSTGQDINYLVKRIDREVGTATWNSNATDLPGQFTAYTWNQGSKVFSKQSLNADDATAFPGKVYAYQFYLKQGSTVKPISFTYSSRWYGQNWPGFPQAPASVTASTGNSSDPCNTIEISWINKADPANFDEIELYYQENNDGNYKDEVLVTTFTNINTSSYTWTVPANLKGEGIRFNVYALNTNGSLCEKSDPGTSNDGYTLGNPAPPEAIHSEPIDNCTRIEIKWTNPDSETGSANTFHIYKIVSGNTSFVDSVTTATTEYYDETPNLGQTVQYLIKGKNRCGFGDPSPISTNALEPLVPKVLNFTSSTEVKQGNNVLEFNFTPQDNTVPHRIYRNGTMLQEIPAGITTYDDETSEACFYYTYTIGGVNGCGVGYQDTIRDRIVPELELDPIEATDGDFLDKIEISWNDVDYETGYRVSKGNQLLTVTQENVSLYVDENSLPGAINTYRVQAINGCNQSNIEDDIGFADPNGEMSGHISTANGEYVEDVEVNVTPVVGKSVKFNGTPVGNGQSLQFPGTPTSVDVGSVSSLIDPSNGITIEGWFNFSSLGNGAFITLASTALDAGIEITSPANSSTLVVKNYSCQSSTCATQVATQPGSLTTNRWMHIAVTIDDNGAVRIYQDGQLAAQSTTTSLPYGSMSVIKLGSNLAGTSAFDGKMDELRIWNSVRSANEVLETFDTEVIGAQHSTLKRYFKFDQLGSGVTKAKNLAPSPNPAEVTIPAGSSFGAPGPAAPVEGGGYINVGTVSSSNFGEGSFSVSLWIKGNGGNIKNSTLIGGGDINCEFTVGKGGALNVANFKAPGSGRISGSTPLNDGVWHNIIYSYDQPTNQMMILVDGQLDATGNVGAITMNNWDFTIGAEENGKYPFKGFIDDVSLWNSVLDTAYLSTYYRKGWGGSEDNLVAYWKLDEGSLDYAFDRSENDLHGNLIDQGYNPGLVEWSTDIAPVKNMGITDSVGNYFIPAINYGSNVNGTIFTVKPSKLENGIAHQFNPQNVTRTLSYTTVRHDGIDFTDISTLPVSGFVKYHNTSCFVEYKEAMRDGKSTNPVAQTDAQGKWLMDSPLGIHEFKIRDPWVKPDSMVLFVDRPLANLMFESHETYSIDGRVNGNCGVAVGPAYIEFENDDQCFSKTILTNADGTYEMDSVPPFPNLKIHVKPVNQLITFDPIHIYHDKDTTINFTYQEDLQAEVVIDTALNVMDACGDLTKVIQQGNSGSAFVNVYEEYPGGNRCYLDTARVRIQDQVSTPAVILDTSYSNLTSGSLEYEFTAGEANLGGIGATQYMKKIEASITDSSGRQTTASDFALVEGVRRRASTFVTTAPDLVFFVLRDPPGDQSYSYLEKDSTYCNAVSIEGTVAAGFDFGVSVKAGLYATAGWIAEVNFQVEIDVTAGGSIEGEFRYSESDEWCFTLSENISTSADEAYVGEEMDLFMGGALNYTFSKIDFLEYDTDNCAVDLSTGVARDPEGIATLFNYTQKHIKEEVIPALEFLKNVPGTPTDTVQYWQDQIDGWNNTLQDNENYKTAAASDKTINVAQYQQYDQNISGVDLGDSDNLTKIAGSGTKYGNVSFSYGSSYDNHQSYAYTNTQGYGGTFSIGGYVGVTGEGNIAGNGFEFEATARVETSIGRDNATTKSYGRAIGYHLEDNDPGDFFSVNIKRDQNFKTPVFETVAGESMCPHEDNTVARENVQISAVQNTIVNIPADEPARFELLITNLSGTEDGQSYKISFDDGFSSGAVLKVNGHPLIGSQSLSFSVPGGLGNNTIKLTATLERAQGMYEHSGIVVGAGSTCESGISSQTTLNAFWEEPCSELSILNPKNNWVVDNSSADKLEVSFTDYDTSASSPVVKFELQFAPENGAWALADELDFSDLLYSGQFGETPQFATLTWNVPPTMPDGVYRVRVKAVCPASESVTDPSDGIVSRDAPSVFGKPEPADGVLDPGDNISITFNENIDCSKLNVESMALKGVLSGFDYNTINHALALAGAGTYGKIPGHPDYNFGTSQDFTVELWVKTNVNSGDPVIVANKDWSNGRNKGWAVSSYQGNRWKFNIGDGADMVNVIGGIIADNQWHHIAAGVDRDYGVILYQDGLIVGTDTSGNLLTIDNIDNGLPITIAQDATTNYSYSFTGTVDELRIWDIFKFQLNILEGRFRSYGFDEANLQGLWRFDSEGSASTFLDRSANQNFGNLSGSPSFDFNSKAPISMENVESLVDITWTCTGNKIVIEPVTPIKYLENSHFTATVFDAKDFHGNEMVQPHSWSFYVDQNFVSWENSNVAYAVQEGNNLVFNEKLVNRGGNLEPYTLSSMPTWLDATPLNGDIPASYKEEITFSIDSFVNPGEYNREITANTNGGFENLDVTVNVLCPPPAWQVDPTTYQHSMSVTASLVIEGDTSKDANDMVSAYVDNQVRGVAPVQHISGNQYLAFITVYSDSAQGEDIDFKIWDASGCKEYPVTIPEVPFYADSVFGSVNNPIAIRTTGMVAQIIDMESGWNWFSLNVNADSLFGGIPVNSALSSLAPAQGDMIWSKTSSSQYYPVQGIWAGSLSDLDNKNMYKLHVSGKDELYYAGFPVEPLNTPISVNPGWNYIGFPVQENIFINTALSSLNNVLSTGDVIKSQYGYAEYVSGLGWFGSLKFLEPGQGYMLKSSGGGTLYFPAQASTRRRVVQNNEKLRMDNTFRTTIAELGWKVKPEHYTDVLNVTGQLRTLDEDQIKDERILVAAFVDDECRGISEVREIDGKWLYYLTAYSNAPGEEEIEFKAYVEAEKAVKEIAETVEFRETEKVGIRTEPFVWHFKRSEGQQEEVAERVEIDGNFLGQNQPNPFTVATTINFGIAQPGKVKIEIHNVHGQVIKTLVSKYMEEGIYTVKWNGTDSRDVRVNQGVYYYSIKTGDFVDSRKMIMVSIDR